MLEIKNVHKTFNKGTINEKKALNGVNLHLDPGDFVTIIGGNGAGKSTTLNMVAGVYPIDQGTIILDGKDISDLPEYKRAYMLGRVFQDPMMERQQVCRLKKTWQWQTVEERKEA